MESRRRALLFGVLGDPVDHSLSPAMHNAAFAAAGLPHLYLRYRVGVRALPAALAEARRLLDALTPEAARIGAVNTIVARGRRLVGDNTDARGFLRALRGRVRLRGARAVVIGAGGAARAVGAALVAGGARAVVVANRTVARGEALAARLAALGCPETRAVPLAALAGRTLLADATLVVNTTSAGLHGGALGLRPTTSPPRCLFVDLVYGTRPTPFLAAAARAGRPIADGTGMLLHQAALAFEAWTGRRAPLAAMARALARAGLPLTRPGSAPSVAAARPATA